MADAGGLGTIEIKAMVDEFLTGLTDNPLVYLMIGTITPPVGVALYVTAKVAGTSFERVTRATLPFLVPLPVVLTAITLGPPLTTCLPGLALGR